MTKIKKRRAVRPPRRPGRDPVRAQYEALPYPTRDPAEEKRRLITGSPSHMDEVNHYVFAGRLDFARPFRALVAGGGTGDAAIMLAQQMAERMPKGEVVYLDLSQAAHDVAQARAETRGLTNIAFHVGSLLDIGRMDLGAFDYIDCTGVLHHLGEPPAGLDALAGALRDGGGMGLMVYGTLGRTGVYPMQAALRALTPNDDATKQIGLTRRLLTALPETNWLRRNPDLSSLEAGDDAGLFDLLLHSRDRAYTVPEVAKFVSAAGLTLVSFIEPARYDPVTYLKDKTLRARAAKLAKLDWLAAAALAENLCGNLKTHVFYVAKGKTRAQALARPTSAAVPILIDTDGPALARKLSRGAAISAQFGGLKLSFDVGEGAASILHHVDGRTNLAAIKRAAGSKNFDKRFGAVYQALNGLNLMLLRFPENA